MSARKEAGPGQSTEEELASAAAKSWDTWGEPWVLARGADSPRYKKKPRNGPRLLGEAQGGQKARTAWGRGDPLARDRRVP